MPGKSSTAACLAICGFAFLLLAGCGRTPPDPSDAIKARFLQFHLHLLKGEIDPAVAFLDPELVKKRGEKECKQSLETMAANYKTNGMKEGDVRLEKEKADKDKPERDKIDVAADGRKATVYSSLQVRKTWNAAPPEKWVKVGSEWFFSP